MKLKSWNFKKLINLATYLLNTHYYIIQINIHLVHISKINQISIYKAFLLYKQKRFYLIIERTVPLFLWEFWTVHFSSFWRAFFFRAFPTFSNISLRQATFRCFQCELSSPLACYFVLNLQELFLLFQKCLVYRLRN